MEHGVILFIEDAPDGGVKIIGKIIGEPEQSKYLANEIVLELMDSDMLESSFCPSQAMH